MNFFLFWLLVTLACTVCIWISDWSVFGIFSYVKSVAAFPSKECRACKAALMVRRSISACWVFPAEKTRPLIAPTVLNPAPILLEGNPVKEANMADVPRMLRFL